MRLLRCACWLLPALMLLLVPAPSFAAGVSISVSIAPPVLPVYEQPLCPQEGWMWVPGYWAYGDDGYYWDPGEWVPAPYQGALWTPAWWGWDGRHYRFHDGYWGDRVGYYGGIDYGFGYMGVGFVGGEWRGGAFAYNTAVMRVDRNVIRNTYVNESIVRSNTIANSRHVAFNGGPNGIHHDPTPVEREGMSGRHTPATAAQLQHLQAARADRTSYAKANGGHPHTLAVARSAEEGRTAGTKSNPERTPARETTRLGATSRTTPTSPQSESHNSSNRVTPESHTATSRGAETRTESRTASPGSASRTTLESRTTRSRTESHAVTSKAETRPESRTAPMEKRRTESHAATAPRAESRLSPEAHAESRPAPTPSAESHTAPAPRTESRPAPQHESRPAPAGHPAPRHASHPEPQPKQEKPKPEPKQH